MVRTKLESFDPHLAGDKTEGWPIKYPKLLHHVSHEGCRSHHIEIYIPTKYLINHLVWLLAGRDVVNAQDAEVTGARLSRVYFLASVVSIRLEQLPRCSVRSW